MEAIFGLKSMSIQLVIESWMNCQYIRILIINMSNRNDERDVLRQQIGELEKAIVQLKQCLTKQASGVFEYSMKLEKMEFELVRLRTQNVELKATLYDLMASKTNSSADKPGTAVVSSDTSLEVSDTPDTV